MTKDEVIEKIKKILEENLEIRDIEVNEDSNLLSDLELSSIEVITMITDIEDAFDVTLDTYEIGKVATLGELADLILASEK